MTTNIEHIIHYKKTRLIKIIKVRFCTFYLSNANNTCTHAIKRTVLDVDHAYPKINPSQIE